MALPIPTSLACLRLRPKGICGFGTPLPSEPDVEIKGDSGCFMEFMCFVVEFTSESLRFLFV